MLKRTLTHPSLIGFLITLGSLLAIGFFFIGDDPDPQEFEPSRSEVMAALEATDFHNALIPPLAPPPDWDQYTLQPGDRLSQLWQDEWHLPVSTLYQLLDGEGARFLNRIHPGQYIEWLASRDGQLLSLRIWRNRAEGVEWQRQDRGFSFNELSTQREIRLLRLEGTLNGILANSLSSMPEIAGQEGAIAAALDRHLPLRRDARDGDTFSLLIEQEWLSDDPTPYSTRLLAFDYQGERMQIRAARHLQDGRFYTPEGVSLIPPFSRTPLRKRFRISSHFNLNRYHPITGRRTPHHGTDFATPTGTLVVAPADGRILRGRYHAFGGNYLVIDHGQGYTTRYLHLSGFLVNQGENVKRGQPIARTGNTGRSTGPHLHYELHINGRPIDAMKVELPSVERLRGEDLDNFKQLSQQLFLGLDLQQPLDELALQLPQHGN
ncbi:peptidoglycan DD-metalloendopeptidase family protein [Marinospirillum perlucidum]|uniref:peptidoglycan DD-metalloendopeptidase family protein n=1 Tax=Marinospirillum perlucidum TaxID=1982602 RepID=UPI000DF28312|nr:peptidoglycan DD-metalloendopeptidase family protein [Marinospirillum perlucidum]